MPKTNSVSQSLYLIKKTLLSLLRIVAFRPNLFKPLPKKKDESVYLLANGPSLKKTLIDYGEFLQSKKSGVVNFFAISPEFIKLKPSYYFLLDQAFFQKNKDQKLNDNIDLLRTALKNVNWRMTLILPKTCKALFSIDNKWISFEYINTNIFQSFPTLQHFAYKRNWGIPQAQNVLVFALYALVYLRVPKIYVLGANHNWHEGMRIREDNKLALFDPHFYKESPSETEKVMDVRIADFFESISKAFRGYEVLSIFATKSNANIINLDTSSFIDSFPKETLETKK
jgi:hypothetical protein